MRPIGFSTGALALGDFQSALGMLKTHTVSAVELSALRDNEVANLMAALGDLDLSRFSYVSFHAPSRFKHIPENRVVEMLTPCIERQLPIVLHPDAISDPGCWLQFGKLLCIENMDKRKKTGRTAAELEPFFEMFPDAGFCLDIAHTRQIDGTMTEANELLRRFGARLTQVHLSEIDAEGHHHGLSVASVRAVRRIAERVADDIPIIVESQIRADEIDREIAMAHIAFEKRQLGATDSEVLFSAVD